MMEVTEKVEPVAKKPRKRMKGILSKVREQMEFYFSDSNLSRDRFLSKQIKASSDGYVDLSLFLTFNKLKAITDDVKVIGKSLRDSQLLKVSDDGQKIKRVKPMCEPKELDERMVYVECLPHHIDHNWIRKMFSSCGKVNYVSLPRYKSTGDPKGFAFVEFDSVEGAKKACEELNNPPVEAEDRPGRFPKTRKQLTQLQRKLGDCKDDTEGGEEQISQVEDSKDLPDAKLSKRQKRRRRLTSESSIDGGTSSDVSPVKRRITSTETERKGNDDDQDDEENKKRRKKRKQRGHTEVNIGGKKRKEDDGEGQSEEKVEEKKKKRKSSGMEENSEGDSVESVERKQKRKSVESCESMASEDGKKRKTSDIDNEESKKEDSAKEQSDNQKIEKSEKKRKRRKKKKQKEKDIPELRVIFKKEWLDLRAEYLSLQKKSMAELKKTITTINSQKEEKEIFNEKKDVKPKIEYVADVIVKVNCGQSLTVKELKSSLEPDLEVAYIDVQSGSNEGYIRCKNAESAKRLSEASSGAYFFTLVKGEEEQKYWTKLQSDRETKLGKKTKDKRRGAQKLIDKAQKINKENMERKHIVFTD